MLTKLFTLVLIMAVVSGMNFRQARQAFQLSTVIRISSSTIISTVISIHQVKNTCYMTEDHVTACRRKRDIGVELPIIVDVETQSEISLQQLLVDPSQVINVAPTMIPALKLSFPAGDPQPASDAESPEIASSLTTEDGDVVESRQSTQLPSAFMQALAEVLRLASTKTLIKAVTVPSTLIVTRTSTAIVNIGGCFPSKLPFDAC